MIINPASVTSNANYVRPESFGAIGDGITDDTIAIQKAINAVSGAGLGYVVNSNGAPEAGPIGWVVLSAKKYKISSTLTITSSYVGICGQGMRASFIVQSSPGLDIISISGTGASSNTAIAWVCLKNFTVMRSGAFTGTPNGIKLNFAYWAFISNIESWNSYNNFYITNSASHLNMEFVNAISSVSAPRVNAGFFFDGGQISSRIIDCVATTIGGQMTYGAYLNGPGSDLFFDRFETAVSNEGMHVNGSWSDLFITDPIFESGAIGLNIVGSTGIIQIRGGYYSGASPGIEINNSKNVQLTGGMFSGGGAFYSGVFIHGTSGNNVINGATFKIVAGVNTGAAIVIDSNGMNIASNNIITTPSAPAAGFGINIRNASVHNTVNGNSIDGFFVNGMNFDVGSNNNACIGNVINSANITTPINDAGTGNLKSNITV